MPTNNELNHILKIYITSFIIMLIFRFIDQFYPNYMNILLS